MNTRLVAVIFILLWVATPVFAHRLDAYLQAATFAVERDHVALTMRLTPGVAVLDKVLAAIDANGDGVISGSEEQGYAERVRRDLTLTRDGSPLQIRLVSSTFPALQEMKEGLGEMVLHFEADVPGGGPPASTSFNRKLIFENHHQRSVSVYLANCLVPSDPAIQIVAQDRNLDQSFYQLDYAQSAIGLNVPSRAEGVGASGRGSLFRAFFYQGVHHILTGYDHLLFVTALVLAATTLWELVKVVFTFTLAHTITLTLAAFNVVHLPGRIVEPLIAASIVFVAVQNVFWPSRARGWSRLGAAFFFGLFHGLGFAGGFLDAMREMQGGTMVLAIVAFSIGVEAGHQMVVLPLFAFARAARRSKSDAVARVRFSMALQRIGSAGISMAGVYYLCVALVGNT